MVVIREAKLKRKKKPQEAGEETPEDGGGAPPGAKRARGRQNKRVGRKESTGNSSQDADSQSADESPVSSASNSLMESPTKAVKGAPAKSPKGQRINRRSPRLSGASDSDSNQIPMRVTRRSSRSSMLAAKNSQEIKEKEEDLKEEPEEPEEPAAPTIETVEDCENLTASVSNLTSTRRLLGVSLEKVPLSWNHKVNLIGEKVLNPRLHLCEICQQPILIYGRNVSIKLSFSYSLNAKLMICVSSAIDPLQACILPTMRQGPSRKMLSM